MQTLTNGSDADFTNAMAQVKTIITTGSFISNITQSLDTVLNNIFNSLY